MKNFPRENLHVLLLEDLESFPIQTCNKIFDFLDIEKFNVVKIPYENYSVQPKSKIIYKLINHPNSLTRFAYNLFGSRFKKKLKTKLDNLNKQNLQEFNYHQMKTDTQYYLIKYF